MDTIENFYKRYLDMVHTADGLLMRPLSIKTELQNASRDIEHYGACLSEHLSELQEYPSLATSLFRLIGQDGMTGYLGEFLIDEALRRCARFTEKETEIRHKTGRIKDASISEHNDVLDQIIIKAESWRRIITIDNLDHIEAFMTALETEVERHYDTLSTQDKLGRALARSEEERRRLLEIEEDRKRGITAKELDKEEKRRRAREEYTKNIKIRKKK